MDFNVDIVDAEEQLHRESLCTRDSIQKARFINISPLCKHWHSVPQSHITIVELPPHYKGSIRGYSL